MLIKKLFIDASQAELAYLYRNVKIKISTITADIYFNKQCIANNVIPKYAKIKINCQNVAARKTKEQAEILFVKNTIKEHYCNKEKLTSQIYDLHMKFIKMYGLISWNLLCDIVENEIVNVIERKYKKINNKLLNLRNENSVQNEDEGGENVHQFKERLVNYTNVNFTEKEKNVMEYGLKHNFMTNIKKQAEILATDVEANVRTLKNVDQNVISDEVCKNISFSKEVRNLSKKKKEELKECINIKKKLEENNLVAVKADKSNAIVIIEKENYIRKTEDFIKNNNFKELKKDPTEKLRLELCKTVKKCNRIIPENCMFRINVPNCKAPVMKGLPKIHKENIPVRPLVNFKSAPSYNVSKILANNLTNDLDLEHKYTGKNCYDFVEKVKDLKLSANIRIISFDVSNLYTNVPVNETVNLIKLRLREKEFENMYVNQMVTLLKLVLSQNYFRFNNKFYLQEDGLAMGSPLSAFMSEVFLQHNEELIIDELKKNHHVILYARYVDDVFLMYNETACNEVDKMSTLLNTHHKNLSFTTELEKECKLNFLDLTLKRFKDTLKFGIYRKPTQTSTTIHHDSVHPFNYKTASFRSMLYRAYKLPLSNSDREKEIGIIKSIARANGYKTSIIDEIGIQVQKKIKNQDRVRAVTTLRAEENRFSEKYVTFHFTGSNCQNIANRFKKYNVKVAFKSNNTMSNLLHPKIEEYDKFNRSGIYKIECNDCDKFYIGQTVNFNKRFKNHVSAWKNNKPERSNVAKHLLECNHNLKSVENNLNVLQICNKGNIMSAWEEFFIFKEMCKDRNKLINEQVKFDSSSTYKNMNQLIE